MNGVSRIETSIDVSGNIVEGLKNKNLTEDRYYLADNI